MYGCINAVDYRLILLGPRMDQCYVLEKKK